MVHEVEALRGQLEKSDGQHSQTSARQYAEDLEVQLEHVECLKGDLELELAKAQTELRQLKSCVQVFPQSWPVGSGLRAQHLVVIVRG